MTPEQRQTEFTKAYNELVQRFGIVLEPQLQVEQLGTAVLTKPVMGLAFVNNWQPVTVPKESAGNPADESPAK